MPRRTSLPSRMGFPRPAFRLLSLLALVALTAPAVGCSRPTSTVVASRQNVIESAVASGRVASSARIQVGVLAGGVVAEVPVREGQVVKPGDLLVRLDDRVEEAAVAQARAAVAQARARLLEVKDLHRARAAANLAAAEAELSRAENAAERTRKLRESGSATTVDLESADTALALARAKRDAAAAEARANAEDGSLVRVAEAQLEAARAQLQAAEARLAQMRVTALVDATVLRRAVEPGDAVMPGRTLLVLGQREDADGGGIEIIVEPDEKLLAVLEAGQEAACAADAFPSAPFAAVVKEIAPLVDVGRGTVEVRLSVPEPPSFLRADMTVSVEVKTGLKENALVLPLEAVRELATSAPWVLVVEEGVAQRRSVTLGARGLDVVEIRSGLVDGAVVVTDPKLAPGARVKAP